MGDGEAAEKQKTENSATNFRNFNSLPSLFQGTRAPKLCKLIVRLEQQC